MLSFDPTDQPCYSARLVRPFVELLRGEPWLPAGALDWFAGLDSEQRVPAAPLHQLLAFAVRLSGDEYLGVRASREMRLGDAGALDYAISSAETLEDAVRTACRYMRLLSDVADFSFSNEGGQVQVRHLNTLPLSPYVEDFQLCGFLWNHMRLWPAEVQADLDVWFMHAEPTSREEYTRALGSARLHFMAPFTGFSFDAKHLSAKLPAADPRLHDVIRAHADALLSALPTQKSVSEKLREVLLTQLASGKLGAGAASKRLGMSVRTLGRRLATEGTSFSAVLDQVRRDLSMRYVAAGRTSLMDVALLTGFSDVTSFYRAFRRWTGMTPIEYRRHQQR